MEVFKTVVLFALVAYAAALPRRDGRQEVVEQQPAEVVKVTDIKSPIITTDPLETPSIEPKTNSSAAGESSSAAEPTPVPPSVPITTEQLPPNSPALVPSVVEISTEDPQNTPPPPASSNSTSPAEEDEESDEEESDEEADEEDEEEDEEGGSDEEEEEEEDEEEDDNNNEVVVKKRGDRAVKSGNSNTDPQLGSSVVVVDEDKVSDEEDVVAPSSEPVKQKLDQKDLQKLAVGGSSALQSVPARSPTNEDDEVEIGNQNGQSVVLSTL